MRLAQVGLGSGGGTSGYYRISAGIPGKVRVQASSPRMPDEHRNLRPPWRSKETVSQKNPSVATNKGRLPSPIAVTNTGSRKHVVLLRSFLFRLPVAAEGRLKVTSPIHHRK